MCSDACIMRMHVGGLGCGYHGLLARAKNGLRPYLHATDRQDGPVYISG